MLLDIHEFAVFDQFKLLFVRNTELAALIPVLGERKSIYVAKKFAVALAAIDKKSVDAISIDSDEFVIEPCKKFLPCAQ